MSSTVQSRPALGQAYSGACACGDFAFTIAGPIEHIDHCHCSMCRKSHGAAFATFGGAAPDAFHWLRGEGAARRYRSSPAGSRYFCPRCGSIVPSNPGDLPVAVALGNVAEDPVARPGAHFFVGSKAPWLDIADGLPQFDEYPADFDFDAGERRPPRQKAVTEDATGGSCLCGTVAFEFDRESPSMVNCHCGDCRRAMSAAYATTIAVDPGAFRWLSGERLVVRYEGVGRQHDGSAFCRDCGSPMPRASDATTVVIPAGCLDEDPRIRPTADVHVAEAPAWSHPGLHASADRLGHRTP